tara:strand:- start:4055 stop:4930 length:876 start_codon:yes stop_codon:yes gene_type:complete
MNKKIIILISTLVLIILILVFSFLKSDLPETEKKEENTKKEEVLSESNNTKLLDHNQKNITKTEDHAKLIASKNSSQSNLGSYQIILILSLTLSLICVIVTYLVYRWKRILIKEKPNALVPEEWKKSLDGYKLALIGLKDAIINLQRSHEGQKEISMAMQKNLDQKDELIDRYRKGYDTKIIKKFIERFLRIKLITEELKKENKITRDDIFNIDELLQDAIEDCDIETFSPPIGSDYRKMGAKVSDKVTIEETNDESKNFQVIEVIKVGYKFTGDNGEIIRPSQVKILKYK